MCERYSVYDQSVVSAPNSRRLLAAIRSSLHPRNLVNDIKQEAIEKNKKDGLKERRSKEGK